MSRDGGEGDSWEREGDSGEGDSEEVVGDSEEGRVTVRRGGW